MKRLDVEILPEAEAGIRAALLWYFERSLLAADAFRTGVFDAIDGPEDRADMWAPNEDGIRHYFLSRFPCTVHYELDGVRAVVFAVGHQRRKPGYWEDR